MLEPRLPEWVEPRWWLTPDELRRFAPEAEIGWFDMYEKQPILDALRLATGLKWLNSVYAGLDFMPLEDLLRRGVQITNGTGINAIQVSEFAVLGMLAIARNYPAVVRAQDAHQWLGTAPGLRNLAGSKVLILGLGAIGSRIAKHLKSFEAEVTAVRRNKAEGALTPDEWRGRLGEFDWIVVTVPGTPETRGMIGAAELASMNREAVLVNLARADVIDQDALIAALREKRIHAAMLDVTDPEPLPPDHPLWSLDNAHITMHLSGIPTPQSMLRAVERFAENCERYRMGEPLEPLFDMVLGY